MKIHCRWDKKRNWNYLFLSFGRSLFASTASLYAFGFTLSLTFSNSFPCRWILIRCHMNFVQCLNDFCDAVTECNRIFGPQHIRHTERDKHVEICFALDDNYQWKYAGKQHFRLKRVNECERKRHILVGFIRFVCIILELHFHQSRHMQTIIGWICLLLSVWSLSLSFLLHMRALIIFQNMKCASFWRGANLFWPLMAIVWF